MWPSLTAFPDSQQPVLLAHFKRISWHSSLLSLAELGMGLQGIGCGGGGKLRGGLGTSLGWLKVYEPRFPNAIGPVGGSIF